jgi:hypothetical protein
MERPRARGDGDWSVIGSIPGSIFCLNTWLLKLMEFHGPAPDPDSPMFLARDRVRPLLYRSFGNEFTKRQVRVGVEEEDLTTPHGLRVAGYNRTKEKLGTPLAGAHGGWAQKEDKDSAGNTRYDRFPLLLVIRIAACIAGVDLGTTGFHLASESETTGTVPQGEIRERAARERAAGASASGGRMQRSPQALQLEYRGGDRRVSVAELDVSDGDEEPDEQNSEPPGWRRAQRVSASGQSTYWQYHGPKGSRVCKSRMQAWREFHRQDAGDAVSDASEEFSEDTLGSDEDQQPPVSQASSSTPVLPAQPSREERRAKRSATKAGDDERKRLQAEQIFSSTHAV